MLLIEPDADEAFRRVTIEWTEPPDGEPVSAVLVRLIGVTDYAQDDGQLEPFLLRPSAEGVWSRMLRLPADLRTSYQLCLARGGSLDDGPLDEERWTALIATGFADPDNPVRLPAGCTYGSPGPASVLELPAAPPQPWRDRKPGIPTGELTRHSLAGGSAVAVYQAPGVTTEAPLVVLFDGQQWLNLDVPATFDNLVAAGEIEPCVAVLVRSIAGAERRYHGLTRRSLFDPLMAGLLPFLDGLPEVTKDPARTIVSGESVGGLLATHLARTYPDRFGAVLGQSTSYGWPGGGPGELVGAEEIAAFAGGDFGTRFYLTAGRNERDLRDANRRMRDALAKYDLTYTEYEGGHDYACWHGGLADGLLGLMSKT